jgi:hypothetical protein
MSAKAEHLLQVTSQHAILEELKEHGYAGIDERSKVQHLLAGIKTGSLDSVKTRIMSDASLRSNFDSCVNLFQDFLKQTNAIVKEVTIASVKTGKKNGSNDQSVTPDMSVEDRYYNQKEYKSLSAAKKLGLKLKRQKRGNKSNNSKKRKKELVDLSQRTIKAIASALRPDPEEDESDESDESAEEQDETVPMKPPSKKGKQTSNRNHPALKRTKT